MKKVMILFLLLLAPYVFAEQNVTIAPITFQVNAQEALSKFDQTLLYPESLLKRFRPVGAKISDKRVSQNVISFVATKTVLFISKSVYVNGILDVTQDNRICSKEEVGYRLKMRFDSSDHLLTDNVDELQANVCLRSESDTKITGLVQSKIIIGNNYSKALGPIAINLIKDQVSPLLNALTEEIKSLR